MNTMTKFYAKQLLSGNSGGPKNGGGTRLRARASKKFVAKKEWGVAPDGGVTISRTGLEKILAAFSEATGHPKIDISTFNESRPRPPIAEHKNGDGAVDLIVKRLFPNRRLLEAYNGDQVVRVRVRDNANFRPKMPLKAKHAGGEFYELLGRCPRFPGRY
jgi:hypothetical protein